MSDILKGNRATKINADVLTQEETAQLFSKESFTFYSMLGFCENHIQSLARSKNIDILEYQTLFNSKCRKYEKLFYGSLRTLMRQKIYNDQVKEFSANYQGIYHPYNPYLQKYNGAYLRSYQLFD